MSSLNKSNSQQIHFTIYCTVIVCKWYLHHGVVCFLMVLATPISSGSGSKPDPHSLLDLGPIPETIRSRSAQIRSCDPDRPIAFHKRRSRSAHEIEKIRNQTVYCQLNHDINHSLGNLELKLRGRNWMKNVRLIIYIHGVTMGGVATSFMSADTRASWPVQCTHTVFAHDTTRFGHAIFDRYVYVITVIENIQTVDTRQTMFQ